jgi:creatinine amidohydrolase
MRYADFTYQELRELAPQVAAVLIPLGCMEQQGPHLTVDFDSRMITKLCDDVAAALEERHGLSVVVMPTLPFGPTPEHAGFSHGYVNLRQATHEAVVEDILESLTAQGYQRLLVWRGCGQHDLARVVEAFNLRHAEAHTYQPIINYGIISQSVLGQVEGGHADSFATSICLYLNEARVRREQIQRPRLQPFEWSQTMDFSSISDTGVIGDPTQASREAGERLWDLCIEAGAQIVLDVLSDQEVTQHWAFPQEP